MSCPDQARDEPTELIQKRDSVLAEVTEADGDGDGGYGRVNPGSADAREDTADGSHAHDGSQFKACIKP